MEYSAYRERRARLGSRPANLEAVVQFKVRKFTDNGDAGADLLYERTY
jgi:hypothetical protein